MSFKILGNAILYLTNFDKIFNLCNVLGDCNILIKDKSKL